MALPNIAPYPLPDRGCLDLNRLTWPLKPERAVLLVHDMQNYFLRAYTGRAEPVSSVTSHIAGLIRTARAARVPVVFTQQPPEQAPKTRGLLLDLWGAGVGGEAGEADIVDALRPEPGDLVLTKHRYSAFHGTDLAGRLAAIGRDQIVVTGVYAHLGCLLTCADAFMSDIQPFLVADATADFDAEQHAWALRYAATRCAVVTFTEDAVSALALAGRVHSR